jgi:hypothetical protein
MHRSGLAVRMLLVRTLAELPERRARLWSLVAPHSCRRASTGSMLAARQAG